MMAFLRWLFKRPEKDGESRQREQLVKSVLPAVRRSQGRISRAIQEDEKHLETLRETNDQLRINLEKTLRRLRNLRREQNPHV